ncbi:hypothetical protein FACS189440_18620 [Bacteroidia bacterium]|nr:hypothetical protein FACS189440_18620 [Bacteroidia bacterium]
MWIPFFIYNGGKNISIYITNYSKHDSIPLEMYWDDELFFSSNILNDRWWNHYAYNKSLGKHTLKLKSNDDEEKIEFWIFPMRYIMIDYYGKDFHDRETHESAFLIVTKAIPIPLE